MSSTNELPPFTQGDTPLFTVPITVGGNVQDLTGWTAFFTMTANAAPSSDSDAAIALECTLDSSAIATFQATEDQTTDMVAGTTYHWDVKLKDPTGVFFSTITSGICTVNQSYTRRTS